MSYRQGLTEALRPQNIIRVRDSDYVLVLRCDKEKIQGLPESLVYWSTNDHTPSGLTDMIAARIGRVSGTLAKDGNHISWKVAKESRQVFQQSPKNPLAKAINANPLIAGAKVSELSLIEMILYHLGLEITWKSRDLSRTTTYANLAFAVVYSFANKARLLRQRLVYVANAPKPPRIHAKTQYNRLVFER